MKKQTILSMTFGITLCLGLALLATTATYAQKKKGDKAQVIDAKQTGPMTPAKPNPNAVMLKCEPYNHSDVTAEVNVTNNTGAKIPAGTVIFWKTNKGANGNFSVPGGGMAPNAVLMGHGGDWQDNGPCTAFYKK